MIWDLIRLNDDWDELLTKRPVFVFLGSTLVRTRWHRIGFFVAVRADMVHRGRTLARIGSRVGIFCAKITVVNGCLVHNEWIQIVFEELLIVAFGARQVRIVGSAHSFVHGHLEYVRAQESVEMVAKTPCAAQYRKVVKPVILQNWIGIQIIQTNQN